MSTIRERSRIAAAAAVVVAVLGGCAPTPEPPLPVPLEVPAFPEPDPGDFEPGFIVSDDAFYDSTAMSAEGVQSFLERVECAPSDGSPCLADFRQDTVDQPAGGGPGHCAPYRGARQESAARIVTKVAVACGVSPRTLLVLLQKEQSLLTRPSGSGYERATGYGCPDTADCDAKYFGFFNQLYNAAWQFREYTEDPDWRYRIGAVPVQFSPDPACGASEVRIVNQATANLYNYTPYQPNAAALADPSADGDGCSAWGNLNFWLLWSRWFGDPHAERYPGFLPVCVNLVGGHPCAEPGDIVRAAVGGGPR